MTQKVVIITDNDSQYGQMKSALNEQNLGIQIERAQRETWRRCGKQNFYIIPPEQALVSAIRTAHPEANIFLINSDVSYCDLKYILRSGISGVVDENDVQDVIESIHSSVKTWKNLERIRTKWESLKMVI